MSAQTKRSKGVKTFANTRYLYEATHRLTHTLHRDEVFLPQRTVIRQLRWEKCVLSIPPVRMNQWQRYSTNVKITSSRFDFNDSLFFIKQIKEKGIKSHFTAFHSCRITGVVYQTWKWNAAHVMGSVLYQNWIRVKTTLNYRPCKEKDLNIRYIQIDNLTGLDCVLLQGTWVAVQEAECVQCLLFHTNYFSKN